MERVGILGGTFDPIHLGHLIPAQYACNHLGLDRLILVPSAAPVHRPRHVPASPEHRLRMCRLAAASLPPFAVSDLEVSRAEPSYTVLTLRYFAENLAPGTEIVLLVGEDNLAMLHTWMHVEEIVRLAAIAVLPRATTGRPDLGPLRAAIGDAAVAAILERRVPAPLVPISATEVRRRAADGLTLRGLVPESVAEYITSSGLYRSVPAEPR